MNTKYFLYALAITLAATAINWASLIGSASTSNTGRGSSWSSYGGGYSGGGGGHK